MSTIKLTEIAYKDFKSDESTSVRKKINGNISEVNRLLYQVEQLLNHASKLKNETSSDQKIFYKSTFQRFGRLSERLNKINAKARELSK